MLEHLVYLVTVKIWGISSVKRKNKTGAKDAARTILRYVFEGYALGTWI
jgi:hypothetical protein